MTGNDTDVKRSNPGKISKVQDDNSIIALVPYYWSWYGCIFPSGNQLTGDMTAIPAKEKQ